jgi:hypothetical protein
MGSISGVSPTATEIANSSAFSQSPFVKPLEKQHDRHHDEHEADEHPGDGVDALFKARLGRLDVQALGQLAQQRVVSDREHDGGGAAAHDGAAEKREAGGLARLRGADGRGRLFHGLALARERGLAHKEVLGRRDAHVGGTMSPAER